MNEHETATEWEQAEESAAASAEALADLAGIDPDTGEPPAPKPPTVPAGELVRPVLALVCSSIAPAWGITEPEQEQLAAAYGAVLEKHFPDGVEMGPEITALIITAGVVVPRLGRPLRETPRAQKSQDAQQEPPPAADFPDLKSQEVKPSV